MEKQLANKKILIMVANGVDETAMSTVQRELLKAGAIIKTAGMEPGLVNSWNSSSANGTWGMYFPVDQQISLTLGSDFDCLVVPSGARGIQKLATSAHSGRIVTSFINSGKPAAFMGDAVTLLEKQATGPNVMTDDGTNIPAFIEKMIAHFAGAEADKIAA